MLEQIHKGAQLKAGDVGPAATALDALQQAEQPTAIGGEAAAEGPVLNGTVQLLQLPQQGQQGFGLALQFTGQVLELLQLVGEVLLLGRGQAHVLSLVARGGLSHTGC
jgi:hypothetical protein